MVKMVDLSCFFFWMSTRWQVSPMTSQAIQLSSSTSQDSTVLRNVGLPLAHTAIALASIQRGLGKLLVNKARPGQIFHGDGDENIWNLVEHWWTHGRFQRGWKSFWGIFCWKIKCGWSFGLETYPRFIKWDMGRAKGRKERLGGGKRQKDCLGGKSLVAHGWFVQERSKDLWKGLLNTIDIYWYFSMASNWGPRKSYCWIWRTWLVVWLPFFYFPHSYWELLIIIP